LTGARENDDKVLQGKIIHNLIMHMVAIYDMSCQLVIFSLLYYMDGQDEPDISLCSYSAYVAFDDAHDY
jgi:hypothetical protein